MSRGKNFIFASAIIASSCLAMLFTSCSNSFDTVASQSTETTVTTESKAVVFTNPGMSGLVFPKGYPMTITWIYIFELRG